MDPISISHPPTVPGISTAVPFTLEPNNHHAASFSFTNPNPNPTPPPPPPPAPATAPAPNHPPYAEMIYTAIGALKEKDGSSKRAIGKYIEQVYRDLPPTHSDLLAQHLKHLKSNGLLVMVKKSYMLPRSESESDPHAPPLPPSTLQTPRGRGRPPKPKPHPLPQPFYQHQHQHQPHLQLQPHPLPQNAEPVWAALGLGDDPTAAAAATATATATAATPITQVKRRGPGRPPKIGVAGVGPAVPVRRGRPPGTGRPRLLKRVGRPPKPKSLSAMSNGLKRRPGRPPKNQSKLMVIPFAAPAAAAAAPPPAPGVPTVPPTFPTDSAPIGSPRPRGRPRKNSAAVPVGLGAPARGGTRGRGRGRGVLPVMRQGRPPKLAVVGRSKRPVGRPKGSTAAATAQKVASKELRRKLEYFQSKVKESLGVLKPYFNHESPVTALAAIQELETLATSELNAPPLREETQPLQQLPQEPQPQPQPPQLQMYQQQYPQIPPEMQLQQLLQHHASAPS